MWRELNKVMGRNHSANDPLVTLPEGSTMNHADYINSYFDETIKSLKRNQTTVGPDEFKKYLSPPTDFSFRLYNISEDEILKFINANQSNAVGYDEIDPKIVKMVANIIKTPLAYIINQTFKTGIFPDALKVAKLIPLHKKGDKTNIENKRPISILNVFAKILEKSIYSRLSSYLEANNLLSLHQHGFRRNQRNTQKYVSCMGKRNHILDRNEMEKLKWLVKKKATDQKKKRHY